MATMQSNPMVPRGAADNMSRGGVPVAERGLVSMSPKDAQAAMSRGEAVLLDVREPDEFAHERIAGATLLPLSKFDAAALALAKPNQRLIVQCKSGKRATDACQRILPLASAGNVVLLTGGIEGWKAAGLPTVLGTGTSGISIMRQVQLVVGVLSLVGSALAWFVHPAFVGIPAFLGAGLTFAGATGTCALATLLGMMPWNRVVSATSGAACASGACCKP